MRHPQKNPDKFLVVTQQNIADPQLNPETHISFIAAVNPAMLNELLDRLEAAEKDRDAMRARIEEMEQQKPVDLNYIELMNSAQKIVESYVYFRRFIASTPLENDIAVWMADFVFAQLDAKGEEK